jgi:putative transcriptional regulator
MPIKKPTLSLVQEGQWLTGQFLVAMPGMPDPRFERTVIYICSHGPNGAMGIVVNRLFGEASFLMMLEQLNITISADTPHLPVHFGGPVETGRGFVLHSADCMREGSVPIEGGIALSATVEILQMIADGGGPERLLMALGYSGWGAGQLENEMKGNGWLTVPADEELLFDVDAGEKWERALAKIGIAPELLCAEAGHA